MSPRVPELDKELKDAQDSELCKEEKDIVRRQVSTTAERTVFLWLDKSLVGFMDHLCSINLNNLVMLIRATIVNH